MVSFRAICRLQWENSYLWFVIPNNILYCSSCFSKSFRTASTYGPFPFFHIFINYMCQDLYRSKGTGRRVCLGDRMYSIPCRASCLSRSIWKTGWIQQFNLPLTEFKGKIRPYEVFICVMCIHIQEQKFPHIVFIRNVQ